jgi:hypothetical protein
MTSNIAPRAVFVLKLATLRQSVLKNSQHVAYEQLREINVAVWETTRIGTPVSRQKRTQPAIA